MTTYTCRHRTGVTWSTPVLEEAVELSGWVGWTPVEGDDRPLGVDCTGAATKADLAEYAAELLIGEVTGTRAEMEAAIAEHHEETTPWL